MELGKKQELYVVKKVEFGIYLSSDDNEDTQDKVLLPKKQVPEGIRIGDTIDVFLYKDSKDRLIATTNTPLVTLDEIALLKVVEVGQIGAFLDWGLEKDLLLPFKEQTMPVKEGDECLVRLYEDKSSRLCASMKIYHYLRTDSPYEKDDRVTGLVYEISKEFGAFVAVDNQFSGLISAKELFGNVKTGDIINARVSSVKEDGKLDLSIREKAYLQMDTDAKKVMEKMEENDGILSFNDKASPQLIKEEMNMSKNEFKRAVGHLLKARRIEITEKNIRKIK